MLFPTAASVVQFSGDFVALAGYKRSLWLLWLWMLLRTEIRWRVCWSVATVTAHCSVGDAEKKPLWRPFWNILGSARYTPKIYRYTVANLSFGASKKNPSIGTSWPWVLSALSWSLLQVFQFNGEMIQASKTVRAKLVTLCRSFQFTLKKSGDLFRFPPVFYQKVSMTEKTRNLRFREDLKVKATYVNTRILVQSLVNCLGNGHSAWVDSLLDSVPCTKKSGTAR